MRALNVDWVANLELDVTQICYCLILKKDGVELYITNHDNVLEFLAQEFMPDENLQFDAPKFVQNLGDDGFEIRGYFNDKTISYSHAHDGFLDGAEFMLYQVNWADAAQFNLLKVGVVGAVTIRDAAFTLKLYGIAKPLENRHGRLLQEKCDAQLGDGRCKVDLLLSAYNTGGFVTEIISDYSFVVELVDVAVDAYFTAGRIVWSGGARQRIARQVRKFDFLHLIELNEKPKQAIALLDVVSLQVGCNKSFEECGVKFSNVAEFRGFAHMPGKDFRFAYPQNTALEPL